MTPGVVAKVEALGRAGFTGAPALRGVLLALEAQLEREGWPWSPQASADVDELQARIAALEALPPGQIPP